MFRINRQTEYAIRMLLALSKREVGSRAPTSEIQEEMSIPRAFAQHIIADLARGSFVKTFPGRDGGVMLARPAKEINLFQLMEYFENKAYLQGCKNENAECPFQGNCPICVQLGHLQEVISNELKKVSLDDLQKATNHPYLSSLSNYQQSFTSI